MHDLASPSPTGTLDEKTIARFRRGDTYLSFDRHVADLPDLSACDGCEAGIVQRMLTDVSDEGAVYTPVGGCSTEDGSSFCPACTASVPRVAA